jgi:hypothetical protein
MFKIPRVNVIESDEGFSVEVLGRVGLKYAQGDKTLFVDSEVLVGRRALGINGSSIKNWDSGEPIDKETRKIIIDNIVQAFAWDGTIIDVVWSGISHFDSDGQIIHDED